MNIIWDFDGTIFNTYPRIFNAFDSVLNSKYGLNIPFERIEDLVYIDTKHCAKLIAQENNLDFESLLKEIRQFYDENGEAEKVFSEVIPILEDKVNHQHFLVTHGDYKSLKQKLMDAEIFDCFEEIISKDDGFTDKPAPDSFEYLIQKYDLDKSDTVAVGDRDIDVGAGENSKISTILISTRSNINADFIISDHKELNKTIENIAKF